MEPVDSFAADLRPSSLAAAERFAIREKIMAVDKDLEKTKRLFAPFRALVIDDMAPMRSILRDQLTQIGIKFVAQVSSGEEALKLLAKEPFAVVLADYNLGAGITGQQVLERAKELKLIPDGTIWLMVTAESGKELVSISADHTPDDYIVKPFSSTVLQNRLMKALAKKKALGGFYDAIRRREPQVAVQYARDVITSGGVFAMEGAKQLGKLLIIEGDYEGAKTVYRRVLADRTDQPFASLGLAKALKENGEIDQAKTALLELKDQYRDLVGAYDLLFEIYEETGEAEKAFEVSQSAARIVPSAKRHFKVGQMAMALGNRDIAIAAFEKASGHAASSLMSSVGDLALMLQSYVENKDYHKAVKACGEPRPQLEKEDSYEVLLNAVRAQAYKGLYRHPESKIVYEHCKTAMETVKLDKQVLQVCLAAAICHNDHRVVDRLTTELAVNNHDDPWLLKMIATLTSSTFAATRVQEIVRIECERMRQSIYAVKAAQANNDHAGAIAAASKLMERAPDSKAVQATKTSALIAGIHMSETPLDYRPMVESHVAELKESGADDKSIEQRISELRAVWTKRVPLSHFPISSDALSLGAQA